MHIDRKLWFKFFFLYNFLFLHLFNFSNDNVGTWGMWACSPRFFNLSRVHCLMSLNSLLCSCDCIFNRVDILCPYLVEGHQVYHCPSVSLKVGNRSLSLPQPNVMKFLHNVYKHRSCLNFGGDTITVLELCPFPFSNFRLSQPNFMILITYYHILYR